MNTAFEFLVGIGKIYAHGGSVIEDGIYVCRTPMENFNPFRFVGYNFGIRSYSHTMGLSVTPPFRSEDRTKYERYSLQHSRPFVYLNFQKALTLGGIRDDIHDLV